MATETSKPNKSSKSDTDKANELMDKATDTTPSNRAERDKARDDAAKPEWPRVDKVKLEDFNKDELTILLQRTQLALTEWDTKRKVEAIAAAQKLAEEFGFTLDDLTDKSPAKTTKNKTTRVMKSAGVPKYRNPEDLTQTWTGHGRRPAWVNEYTESGKKLEDLAIAS